MPTDLISDSVRSRYQPVIGLEVHVQLTTESKFFAPEGFGFGASPNSCISPVNLAHPGALPGINRACITHALRIGLATGCEINRRTWFARKNYFYPDLPKGYQLSQDTRPICYGGQVELLLDADTTRRIRLTRIHLEEDAGKSIHDQDPTATLLDLNRAGVGLVEVVTEPDLRSAAEAGAFFAEMRKIVRHLGISDGNMEEGSLRCDANVSVMPAGSHTFGTRAEIKNMNSINFLMRAVEYEIDRQIAELEAGRAIVQQTRTYDVARGITLPMRHKETADDYRYFPEPDLLPLELSEAELEGLRQTLPPLPTALVRTYQQAVGLPFNEAVTLAEDKELADYFEVVRQQQPAAKEAANWLLGPVKAYLNEHKLGMGELSLRPAQLLGMIELVRQNKVSHTAAKEQLLPGLLAAPEADPLAMAQALNLLLDTDETAIEALMAQLIERHPAEVDRYRKGKKGLIGFFVGQLMRELKGKADPKTVNALARKMLEGHR